MNAAGAVVESRRVNVEYGRLSMTVAAPEGYVLADTNNVISIDDNTKTVKVNVMKADAPVIGFRAIRVEFINPAEAIVATKRVNVQYGRLSMTVEAPEGYVLADSNNVIAIDDNTKTVKVAVMKAEGPEIGFRAIRVEYVNAAGAIVSAERVNVQFGKLSITVAAPEGYKLFDTNNVIAIDDETKTVKVQVVKDVKLVPVTVSYVVEATLLADQNPWIEIVMAESPYFVDVEDLKEVPAGYTVVELLANDNGVTAIVKKNHPDEKTIFVNYVTADGKNVLTVNMTVPYDAKTVDSKDLKSVPYGYNLITKGTMVIDDQNSIYPVVALKPVNPDKDNVPKTGDSMGMIMMATLATVSALSAAALISFKKADNR